MPHSPFIEPQSNVYRTAEVAAAEVVEDAIDVTHVRPGILRLVGIVGVVGVKQTRPVPMARIAVGHSVAAEKIPCQTAVFALAKTPRS